MLWTGLSIFSKESSEVSAVLTKPICNFFKKISFGLAALESVVAQINGGRTRTVRRRKAKA